MSAQLYAELMKATPVLPHDLLRATYRDARRRADLPALVALTSRDDLPLDVLTELATDADPKIAAAYRGRTTRPDQAETRNIETRAAVLAKALGRYGDADPYAFADALTAYLAKPTQVLLKALLVRPATWYTPEQASALLTGIDSNDTLRVHEETLETLTARLGPDLAAYLATTATSHRVISHVVRYPLPDDVVATCVFHALTSDERFGWQLWNLAMTCPSRTTAADQVVQLLTGHARRWPGAAPRQLLARVRHLVTNPNPPTRTVLDYDTSPSTPPTVAADFTNADVPVLLAAATSSEARVLTQIVNRLVTDFDHATLPVMPVLLRNANLPAPDALRLVTAIPTNGYDWWAATSQIGTLDALTLWDDPLLQAAWRDRFPTGVLNTRGWDAFGGPQHIDTLLATWISQTRTGQRDPAFLGTILKAAVRAGLSDDNLLALPLDVVVTHLLWGNRAADYCTTADRIARLLTDRMPAGQWVVFSQLADTFTGSLAELLTVTTSVTT